MMLVAGLMSGTSADAIDVALVQITGRGWSTRFRLVSFHSVPYPAAVRRRIMAIASGDRVGAGEISQLNFALGELFAEACRLVCRRARVPMASLQLIGSHGQTISHQNRSTSYCGTAVRSTLQIGETAVIAERTGVTTVGDFRPADIAAGGQGAPLVPFFDYLLFRDKRRGRIALNIGGIANLTAIPAGGSEREVLAFDTGPGNMLLDGLARLASRGLLGYDAGGRLASRGRVSEELLRRLLRQRYFRLPPPKTAGREQFGPAYLKRYFLDEFGASDSCLQDALATAAALTARSIAAAVEEHVLAKFPVQECYVSGGGVKNRAVMGVLRKRLDALGIALRASSAAGIPPQAKEAVAFAVLAYQAAQRQPSSLPAATGARHAAVLGKVVYAAS